MKTYPMGEFEEIVLLTVGVLYDEAYGGAIKDAIEEKAQRNVSVGALQAALKRMEKKGYLESREGEFNAQRGGKPKRYYTITAFGKQALQKNKDIRLKLWRAIPKIAFDFKYT
ncbi:PadR family transcriptional regulator PadR [Catalinimonas alkaloidigena]|uniref:PadR family transcriptional regulator n=1 Tax=Catalinimonas alkaloidigena TaxID=1075417 RepID=UPI002406FD9F|nr:helix-turn-helix transcriptional regulator [Catalinimonas alkaloidigena]MDF9796583.1 PadR family transcriptional regulator PadR [Catalinimonas alkaloidigena]